MSKFLFVAIILLIVFLSVTMYAKMQRRKKAEKIQFEEKKHLEEDLRKKEEEALRLKVEPIFASLEKVSELPSFYLLRMEGSISDVDKYVIDCEELRTAFENAANNADFLKIYNDLHISRPFDTNSYLYSHSNCENSSDYLLSKAKEFEVPLQFAKKISRNSCTFADNLIALDYAAIKFGPRTVEPDIDPDYSGINTTNITARTNYETISDFIVVDVETTGLNAYRNEIVQLSAIRFRSFEPVDCFSTYIHPHNGLKDEAEKVNGITAEMVSTAPYIEEVSDSFREYIGTSLPLVGHNILFDVKFLCNSGCLSIKKKRKYYDTLTLSKKVFDSEKYSLDYLARRELLILRDNAHDAVSDCLTTGILFKHICDSIIK